MCSSQVVPIDTCQDDDFPTDASHIFDKMQRYLCVLYGTGDMNECFNRKLRWALFAQKGK